MKSTHFDRLLDTGHLPLLQKMPRSAPVLALALLACNTFAQRKLEVFVPKEAQYCERGPKFCKRCPTTTTIGASAAIDFQVGGCPVRRILAEEPDDVDSKCTSDNARTRDLGATALRVVELTTTGSTFFKPSAFPAGIRASSVKAIISLQCRILG